MTEEEYFDSIQWQLSGYSEPLYDCPKCGKFSVRRYDNVVLTCYPPKHRYDCTECGYTTTR